MTGPRSLRLRLLASGVIGVLLASVIAGLWLGRAFAEASERAFDRQLRRELEALIVHGEVDDDGRFALQGEPGQAHYARLYSGHYWRVVSGERQFQSRSLWDASLAVPLPAAAGAPHWHEVRGPRGEPLRAWVQAVAFPGGDGPVVFVVAADRRELSAEAADFRLLAGGAVAVLAATLLLLLALQVGFALRPLSGLADTAERVRRGEAARFPTAGLPSEVAPLASHLNELLAHHERSVQRARGAAQDLAHALKTPLAVLALEAERPGPQLPALVQAQVQAMRASVDRHLGRGGGADPRARTPVAPVVDALLALMRRVHGERGLVFERTAGDAVAVFAGDQADLEEMLGNLLDNAGKWARARVRVETRCEAGRLRICVSDDGPGLPAAALAEVTGRGVRADQHTPGSGLGLAIVQDIAGSYGGGLHLASPAQGLQATLDLPAA